MAAALASIILRSNGAPGLADTIASVAQQTYRPLEIVVVDMPGAGHPALPPLPGLAAACLVGTGKPLFRAAATNLGIDHATGEWIGFLDAGDLLEETHVARLLARAGSDDAPRLVHGQSWILDPLHRVTQQRHVRIDPLLLHYHAPPDALPCLLHRSLVADGLRLDASLEGCAEWELWLRLSPRTTFATVSEPTHFHVARGDGEPAPEGTLPAVRAPCRDIVASRHAATRDLAWSAYFAQLGEGIALLHEGRADAALDFFEGALREHPDEPNALYMKAQCHASTGEFSLARRAFRQAIALNADAADYHAGLGDACARLGRMDEARAAYADAMRYQPALQEAMCARIASLPPSGSEDDAPATTPTRNDPCPCGSGLRYKQCHGKLVDGAPAAVATGPAAMDPAASVIAPFDPQAQCELAGVLARAGDNRGARAMLRAVLDALPDTVAALHAHAVLAWDAGDLAGAQIELARAAALSPQNAAIARDWRRLREVQSEREHARAATRMLRTRVGAASGRPLPGAMPPGTPVHLISPFENAFAGTELHALEVARLLAPVAPVHVWATQPDIPADLAARGVVYLDAARGALPREGVFVFFGTWQGPPAWIAHARPSRVLVVHNVDNATALLDLVEGLLERTSLPVELLMPSVAFQAQCGLPGTAYPTPVDLARFAPRNDRAVHGAFTVGRLSRNVDVKYHPDDATLARRMLDAGMRVRFMGGTVLRRYFPPATPVLGLELLPPGYEAAPVFLGSLDALCFRTNPSWRETAGRVVAEAMACGVPCVCARSVGFAELITPGADGFVVDDDDDDGFFRCLCLLRDDPSLRRAMSLAARTRAEHVFGPALAGTIRRAYLGG